MKTCYYLTENFLHYENKVCVPRSNIQNILLLVQDSRKDVHLGYPKILFLLVNYHSKIKSMYAFHYFK